jgi:hypothetical protein
LGKIKKRRCCGRQNSQPTGVLFHERFVRLGQFPLSRSVNDDGQFLKVERFDAMKIEPSLRGSPSVAVLSPARQRDKQRFPIG